MARGFEAGRRSAGHGEPGHADRPRRDIAEAAPHVRTGDLGVTLRQRGLVRLALRGRTGIDRELAGGRDARDCALVGAEAGRLHRVADAEADIAPRFARLRLARGETVIISGGKRLLLAGRIIAAV